MLQYLSGGDSPRCSLKTAYQPHLHSARPWAAAHSSGDPVSVTHPTKSCNTSHHFCTKNDAFPAQLQSPQALTACNNMHVSCTHCISPSPHLPHLPISPISPSPPSPHRPIAPSPHRRVPASPRPRVSASPRPVPSAPNLAFFPLRQPSHPSGYCLIATGGGTPIILAFFPLLRETSCPSSLRGERGTPKDYRIRFPMCSSTRFTFTFPAMYCCD